MLHTVWVSLAACDGKRFQWAPTLGGECYTREMRNRNEVGAIGFNGHPPLGVNATRTSGADARDIFRGFQWAPTLGGECYRSDPYAS